MYSRSARSRFGICGAMSRSSRASKSKSTKSGTLLVFYFLTLTITTAFPKFSRTKGQLQLHQANSAANAVAKTI